MYLCEVRGSHSGTDHDSSLLRYDTVLIGKCLLNLRRVKQSMKAFTGLLRLEDVAIKLLETSVYSYQSARRNNTDHLNLFADYLLSGTRTRWRSCLRH
jgi:hypothetical protein